MTNEPGGLATGGTTIDVQVKLTYVPPEISVFPKNDTSAMVKVNDTRRLTLGVPSTP